MVNLSDEEVFLLFSIDVPR